MPCLSVVVDAALLREIALESAPRFLQSRLETLPFLQPLSGSALPRHSRELPSRALGADRAGARPLSRDAHLPKTFG